MNPKYTTVAIAAYVASIAITAVGLAVPKQALAHYGHISHSHGCSISVNQTISQLNARIALATMQAIMLKYTDTELI